MISIGMVVKGKLFYFFSINFDQFGCLDVVGGFDTAHAAAR